MSLTAIGFCIAIGLAVIGIGLALWAYLNPKWQHADAYDALIPFSLGVMLLIAAGVVAVVAGVFRLIFGGGA